MKTTQRARDAATDRQADDTGPAPARRPRPGPLWDRLATADPGTGLVLQAKLEVGPADDLLEREADRAADRVADGILAALPGTGTPLPSGAGGSAGLVAGPLESRIDSLRGRGAPLDHGTRARMEPRFGHDFGGVRVHTGGEAAAMARSLGARAFTTGSDVFFGAGQYRDDTDTGRRLLAHELTHVVQQGGGERSAGGPSVRRVQRDGFWSGAWDVTKAIGGGIWSVGEDLVGGVYRTARSYNFWDREEQARIGDEYIRTWNLLKDIVSNRGAISEIVEAVIEHLYKKLPEERKAKVDEAIRRGALVGAGYMVGRMVIGKQIATRIARRIAGRIAASQAFKALAVRLGVSAGAGATGIGIPITLLMLVGTVERAGQASRRLAGQHPELYADLRGRNLDMAWFLVEPSLAQIEQEFNTTIGELESQADTLPEPGVGGAAPAAPSPMGDFPLPSTTTVPA
jgi:hypothetical protein